MLQRPDYETLRQKTKFGWSVSVSIDTILKLMDIPMRDFYLNPKAGIEAYRKGRPLARERFGQDVRLPAVFTPRIFYGFSNSLGSRLTFPENAEVGQSHLYTSLAEGIAALQRPVDFAKAGMAPHYLEYREQLFKAFPNEPIGYGLSAEGPLTTAYELRGQDFFTDVFDEPEQALQFLDLISDGLIRYRHWIAPLHEAPPVSPDGIHINDDLASLIPARMWQQFVLPFWEKYYRNLTTGRRTAHVENLRAEQLKFLEAIGLVYYDPSVSPLLNPRIISESCRVPFAWKIFSFQYRNMSCRDVEDVVFQAVADGASSVATNYEASFCDDQALQKVGAFTRAARQVQQMFDQGATREQIGQCVSAAGKEKLWDHWFE